MMYSLLTTGANVPDQIAAVLAEIFSIPVAEVDVSAEGEYDSRNWDASVSCEYSRIHGDLNWSLSITTSEAIESAPPEESLAKDTARSLAAAVVFPAGLEEVPWIDRVATPTGNVAYIYTVQQEGDEGSWTEWVVDSCEILIPEFSNAQVRNFPEIIRPLQLPTPAIDACIPKGHPERDLCWPIVNWERLTVRMTTGWPPSSWYPAEMYVEDLELRDEVTNILDQISPDNRACVFEVLERVDQAYRELTVDDQGISLIKASGLPAEGFSERSWYWQRRPSSPPWERK